MTTPLPTNVGATDWAADADKGAAEHRDWHDRLHAAGLLARVRRTTASTTSFGTTSASHADIDAVNLTASVLVPASGLLLVTFTATTSVGANTSLSWNLRMDGADVSETASTVAYTQNGSIVARVTIRWLLSGLTPSATVVIRPGHARAFGTGTVETQLGGERGPALLEVWQA